MLHLLLNGSNPLYTYPCSPSDVPHCDDGSEEEMEDDEGELESGKPSSSERLSSQVNHPSSQAPPGMCVLPCVKYVRT